MALEQTYLSAFVTALPAYARARLTLTADVIANAHKAELNGWTTKQLVDEVMRNHNGAGNTGGIIAFRLTGCAEGPPAPAGPAKLAKIHDGCCDGGFRYDETVDPPRVTKCPGATR